MDEGRSPFEGLHQVRFDRILHQYCQCACHSQVFCRDGLTLPTCGNHHLSETVAHIFQAGGQRKDRHDLGSDGDVITGTMLETGFLLASPTWTSRRKRSFTSITRRHWMPFGSISRRAKRLRSSEVNSLGSVLSIPSFFSRRSMV